MQGKGSGFFKQLFVYYLIRQEPLSVLLFMFIYITPLPVIYKLQ